MQEKAKKVSAHFHGHWERLILGASTNWMTPVQKLRDFFPTPETEVELIDRSYGGYWLEEERKKKKLLACGGDL